MHRDLSDDKPFVCPVADCGMRFINEDHLHVHSKKHEMSLALNAGGQTSNSPGHHFLDQTPTPTKFLKNCDEISLFQELQNPFDHAYKKALDNDPLIPGPQTGELNTPTLILSDSLKTSSAAVAAAAASLMPSLLEKTKGTEPLKPSPLAKTATNRIMLDLSGKSVMSAQSPATKLEAIRSNFNSQEVDHVNSVASVLEPAFSVGTTRVTAAISSSHLPGQTFQHSTPAGLATFQHHLTSGSSPAAAVQHQPVELFKKEIKKEDPGGILGAGSFTDQQQQQQCTMQVLLQLPNGETVPISIPATINKFQYLSAGHNVQPSHFSQAAALVQQPPQLQPAPSKMAATANLTTSMALKQRLKAQLQNQLSPTAKASDISMIVTNPTVLASSSNSPATVSNQVLVGSTSPIMMVDSPGSEMNLSDSSDYSIDSKRQKMSPETGDPEERRRKFLERNRAAAARCRQKRKHWISNLEKKADELQNTNLRLQSEVKLLRGEVAQLKTLLLAHKDCPVTQQQRLQGHLQHIILTDQSLASQELAQVVPNADGSSEPLQLTPAIVTFLQESVTSHSDDLEMSNE